MGMNVSPIQIVLSEQEEEFLTRLSRSQTAENRAVQRARTILLLSQKLSLSEVARAIGCQRRIVRKWGERFVKKRLKGLSDEPRSGRPARFSPRSSPLPGEDGL